MNSKNGKRNFSQRKPKDPSAFSLPKEPVELTIEKLSFGGDGIARKDGLVYFVPLSAPGDRLLAKVTEQKKNFARAEVIEILKNSPSRIQAPCPVFGKCGGCNWQHISYEEQLKQKHQILQEQLKGLVEPGQIPAVIPSPNPFRYRNRVQFKFDGKAFGFYARQSHQVIDIQDCPITEELITEQILPLKSKLLRDSKPVPKVEVYRTPANEIRTRFEDSAYEDLGFAQVNSAQNDKLIETVLSWWSNRDPQKIYDLYSGAGNFTFPLFQKFPKASLIGADLSSKSIESAQKQTTAMNLSPLKMKFYLSDVELFLKRMPIDENSLVLLDPPRAGCSPGVIQALAQQRIQSLLYISCNPSALARDLKSIISTGRWKIARVQAFDMFPQTDHVETLVELLPTEK